MLYLCILHNVFIRAPHSDTSIDAYTCATVAAKQSGEDAIDGEGVEEGSGCEWKS